MPAVLWESESAELSVDSDISFSKDLGGVLAVVVDCYNITGAHGRSAILFIGQEALALTKKWREFHDKLVYASDDWDGDGNMPEALDVNGEPMEALDVNGKPMKALDKFAAWLKATA